MKVLVTGKIPDEALELLRKEHDVLAHDRERPMERDELLERIGDKHGLLSMLTDRVDTELLQRAENLKMVANCAVGYDNIDLPAATSRGILVSNTPGVLTNATADITMALILAAARRVVEGDRRTRTGKFRYWSPMLFLGTEVTGKTVGIVGLGQIGRAVAARAKGFEMRILYHNRSRIEPTQEQELNLQYADLKTLLKMSDFVSLHVPLTPETRGLISRDKLDLMKETAYLINAARGPVVDETALVEALRVGSIAGAGLDVYENEPKPAPGLTDLENVVLLPHVGSATLETRTAMATLAARNLLAGLRGDAPPNCLNGKEIAAQNV